MKFLERLAFPQESNTGNADALGLVEPYSSGLIHTPPEPSPTHVQGHSNEFSQKPARSARLG